MARVPSLGIPYYSRKSLGRQGYCMLCVLFPEFQDGVDDRVRRGFRAVSIANWLAEVTGDSPVNRATMAKHINHVLHPKDRLVKTVVKRTKDGTLPQTVTETEYLDSVIKLANHNMISDPNSVTIDHGLRASQIKMQERTSKNANINVLVGFINGGVAGATFAPVAQPVLIEGTATYGG